MGKGALCTAVAAPELTFPRKCRSASLNPPFRTASPFLEIYCLEIDYCCRIFLRLYQVYTHSTWKLCEYLASTIVVRTRVCKSSVVVQTFVACFGPNSYMYGIWVPVPGMYCLLSEPFHLYTVVVVGFGSQVQRPELCEVRPSYQPSRIASGSAQRYDY